MMKNWKSIPVLFFTLLTVACLNTSCKEGREVDEDVSYEVDVVIVSPTNNELLAIGENFKVEVNYKRPENTIHNVKVEIVDIQGVPVYNLMERHAHVANEFTFVSDPISIGQAGDYFIRASTTDLHNGDGEAHHEGGNDDDKDNLVEHTITIQ